MIVAVFSTHNDNPYTIIVSLCHHSFGLSPITFTRTFQRFIKDLANLGVTQGTPIYVFVTVESVLGGTRILLADL